MNVLVSARFLGTMKSKKEKETEIKIEAELLDYLSGMVGDIMREADDGK